LGLVARVGVARLRGGSLRGATVAGCRLVALLVNLQLVEFKDFAVSW